MLLLCRFEATGSDPVTASAAPKTTTTILSAELRPAKGAVTLWSTQTPKMYTVRAEVVLHHAHGTYEPRRGPVRRWGGTIGGSEEKIAKSEIQGYLDPTLVSKRP